MKGDGKRCRYTRDSHDAQCHELSSSHRVMRNSKYNVYARKQHRRDVTKPAG